jgi:hypothetical protein
MDIFNRGQEAAPLVVSKTMYVITPYPNILYALDLGSNGAAKWKYEPKPSASAQGVACCDVVNRGCVYWESKIIFNTLDVHTVAVDANTGKELRKTKLGEINKRETITMAPLVVKGKVLVGNSGGQMGVRGWLTALDVNSGKIAWRAYKTGPDKDCLIGEQFKPFYASEKGKDLGVATWPPDQWKIGGDTVWGWISYDPELDYIYYATGNPGPWNPELRLAWEKPYNNRKQKEVFIINWFLGHAGIPHAHPRIGGFVLRDAPCARAVPEAGSERYWGNMGPLPVQHPLGRSAAPPSGYLLGLSPSRFARSFCPKNYPAESAHPFGRTSRTNSSPASLHHPGAKLG